MPINLDKYHPKWTLISRLIRKRANNCCEACGVENARIIARAEDSSFRYVTDQELQQLDLLRKNGSSYWGSLKALGFTRVILSTAHLDRNTDNNRFSNLKAFCQRCHFKYDWPANEMAKRYGKNDRTLLLFKSMKYIILVSSNKSGRNNLQTDLQSYLNEIYRSTIEDPNNLFLHLVEKVGKLNKQNTRCTPVTITRSNKTLFHFEERSKVDSLFSTVKLVEIGKPLELNP